MKTYVLFKIILMLVIAFTYSFVLRSSLRTAAESVTKKEIPKRRVFDLNGCFIAFFAVPFLLSRMFDPPQDD